MHRVALAPFPEVFVRGATGTQCGGGPAENVRALHTNRVDQVLPQLIGISDLWRFHPKNRKEAVEESDLLNGKLGVEELVFNLSRKPGEGMETVEDRIGEAADPVFVFETDEVRWWRQTSSGGSL